MESQNQQTQEPNLNLDIDALRTEVQQAEQQQQQEQKQEQLTFKDALAEVGASSAQALGADQEPAPTSEGTPESSEKAKSEPAPKEEVKPQVREVYQYIHPELVKQSAEYRDLSAQAAAVDALASTIREQLALAHEGKPIKLVKNITPEGQIVFTEERMPTGADIVELQRQYNLAANFKMQIDQRIQALEQSAQQDYAVVDNMIKLADEQVFSKLDFTKGKLGEIYSRLSSVVPKHINDIPVFNSYIRLLALNEALAQALTTRNKYNGVMNTAMQHAGPGPSERQPASDELKYLDEQFNRILGR